MNTYNTHIVIHTQSTNAQATRTLERSFSQSVMDNGQSIYATGTQSTREHTHTRWSFLLR